jgi:hypothetical protein
MTEPIYATEADRRQAEELARVHADMARQKRDAADRYRAAQQQQQAERQRQTHDAHERAAILQRLLDEATAAAETNRKRAAHLLAQASHAGDVRETLEQVRQARDDARRWDELANDARAVLAEVERRMQALW